MKLLKNKAAWKRWAKAEGIDTQDPPAVEPVQYPCFAYTRCQSFAYEELGEEYIFEAELADMLSRLKAVK